MFPFGTASFTILLTIVFKKVIFLVLRFIFSIINRALKPFGFHIYFETQIEKIKNFILKFFAKYFDAIYTLFKKKSVILVLSGPSCVGKNTVEHFLRAQMEEIGMRFNLIKSYTTRAKRKDSIDKYNYNFVSVKKFKKKIDKDEMLEYVINPINNAYYGFDKNSIKISSMYKKHSSCIATYNFLKAVQKFVKENNFKNCHIISVYLMPISLENIKERLQNQKNESQKEINKRIANIKNEIKDAKHYDYKIVNKESYKTANEICDIILNRLNRSRRPFDKFRR